MKDAPDVYRDKLAIALLWNTGVRVSEAVDIRVSDIDRDERSIQIHEAKSARHAKQSTREVYYGRKFARMLGTWLDGGRRKRYPGAHSEDFLLPSKEGEQLKPERLTDIVREAAEDAGIQEVMYEDKAGRERRRVHAHLLRKSYGVHRIRSDTGEGSMPLPYLQDLMGHDDISTTRDRYLKYRQDDVREAERAYSPSA